MKRLIISLLILVPFFTTYSFVLDEKLSDNRLEERATNLFKIVKCPVCSGESLYESQSQLAYNIRKAIRERIKSGDNDDRIILDLKHVYGNQIINTPHFNHTTYIVWTLPILIFFIGILTIVAFYYRNKHSKFIFIRKFYYNFHVLTKSRKKLFK